MTEHMIVEAVRSAGGYSPAEALAQPAAVQSVPDPDAVSRFEAAMAAPPVQAASEIPFADKAAAAWRMAEADNQGMLHRIHALTRLSAEHSLSAPELLELQYEVANLAFQQEVVAKVADKSSSAVQTLIKNQ